MADDDTPVPKAANRKRRPPSGRLCNQSKRNGDPCRNYAISGGLVCATHGGSNPAVKAKAEARIQEAKQAILDLVPKATRVLEEILENPDAQEKDRIKVAERILDQAGLVITRKVEADIHEHTEVKRLDDEIDTLLGLDEPEEETG